MIKDNGISIPQSNTRICFILLFRIIASNIPGTGLGLNIVLRYTN